MRFSNGSYVSNCCGAELVSIEIDICSDCMEHCEAVPETEEDYG